MIYIDLQDHWGDCELYYVGALCAKIIEAKRKDEHITLYTKECRSAHENGGFALLDELCNFYGWDKKSFTFETPNMKEKHDEYNISILEFFPIFIKYPIPDETVHWTITDTVYGMFIGRANSDRIMAAQANNAFKFKDLGLTSFHDDLFEYFCKPELVRYFMNSGKTYSEMLSVKQHSDIDQLHPPPIVPPVNEDPDFWSRVYSRIGIEIVCETSTSPDTFCLTEKLVRCIAFKRPFLLVGPPGFLEFLRSVGLKVFDGVIPTHYDDLSGKMRVDSIFSILEDLISSGKIYKILTLCANDIEHNYNFLLTERQTSDDHEQYARYEKWVRKKFRDRYKERFPNSGR